MDNAIQRLNNRGQINHYPTDKYYGNQLRYPLDSDLSGGDSATYSLEGHADTKGTCHCVHIILASVVQTLDSAIHQINHYPTDKYYGNQLRHPLDSDLSGG